MSAQPGPALCPGLRESGSMMMRGFVLGAVAALAVSGTAFAAARPDLSGDWILQSDPMAVPTARTTTAGARQARGLATSPKGIAAVKGSPEYASVWCTHQGMPWQQTNSLPLTIVQGALETLVLTPVRSDRRHLYTDGQPHPDPDVYDPTTVGHSIGRWQGDSLVVETVGFSDKGVLLIPGGGVRSPASRLVERYRLADQNTLRVTYTWTDRATLRAPHSYTYVYKRAEGPIWAREVNCNPLQSVRAAGLPLPPGAPQF
jgi:hypothetical protein